MLLGLAGGAILAMKPISLFGRMTLDIDALLYCAVAAIVGFQIFYFGLFAIALARKLNLRVASGIIEGLLRVASLERAIGAGAIVMGSGVLGALYAVVRWGHSSFGALVPSQIMRLTIPSVTAIALGAQIVFGAFMLGFIEIE
jgi:hypothetical protein